MKYCHLLLQLVEDTLITTLTNVLGAKHTLSYLCVVEIENSNHKSKQYGLFCATLYIILQTLHVTLVPQSLAM